MQITEEPYPFIHTYPLEQVVVSFSGKLSQDIIVGLGEALREELLNRFEPKYVNRIFAVFIEMLQNVLHYAYEPNEQYLTNPLFYDRVWVLSDNRSVSIATANALTNNQSEKLKGKCIFVNSLSPEELKKEYLQRRKDRIEPDGKGAGIGLFDIVRKSGSKLDYHFFSINNQADVFGLITKVIPIVEEI